MKTAFQHDSSRTSRAKWVHYERRWRGSLRSLAGSQSVLVLALLFGAPGVARAAVVSVTLSPATITGGSGGLSTGTVTVSVPAPAGGQVVRLTSSNTDLAATTPSIVVPQGATSAAFTVGTNPVYRMNSGLAFDAIITASDGASSASAILHVTAQAIPGPFSGGTQSFQNTAQAGNICAGTFGGPSGAIELGSLYQCQFPAPGVNNNFSVCTFLQECAFGCLTTSSPTARNLNRQDVCVTTPPFPVALNPEIVEGGRRSAGTVLLDAPAPPGASANLNSGFIGNISPAGFFPIPQGATTAPFDADTLEVAVPAIVPVRVSLFSQGERHAQDYLAVGPFAGSGPPSGPLAAFLVDLRTRAVVQGSPSIATVILNGVAPSGGAVVSLTSDNPAAIVPPTVTVPAGQTATGFNVETSTFAGANRVTAPTPVTITASFGGECRPAAMTVSPFISPTTPPALFDLTVDPATVIGGTRSTGRATVTTPAPDPSFGAVSIALTSDNEAAVVVPRTVTVDFGGIIGDFTIKTFPVTTPTLVTITAAYNGVTRSATLTVNPPGSPSPPLAVSAVCLNPTALIGGNSSTGTVSLNRAAPAGGVAVALSTDNTVATVPGGVTTTAGQTSANFQVSTTAVGTPTVATISASAGGATKSAALNVNPVPPPPLSSFTVNPTSVAGGNPSTGAVTVASPAPAGGSVVALSSNQPGAASVPPSVTIAAGTTSASFTITTSPNAGTTVTLAATLGNSTLFATLGVMASSAPSTPAAPSLISPAVDATPAQPVTFDWTDVANATSYEIQIDDTSTIAAPFVASATVTASQATIGALPAKRLWWRVRASNSAGVFGPFSATQRFTPQAAVTTASLSSVSVNPATVVGGNGSTGTVTLTAAAPGAGLLVNLSSSNAAVAAVPPSVTVAAGVTSASFAVTTSSVAASTAVTITGAQGATTRTATLTVNPVPPPASLSAITLSPSTVTGGGSATGTATLTSAAPSGGAVVSLSSSNTAASVPASVTVPAGATSATFTVSTPAVTASTSSTISGSFGGATRSAVLTVTPAPAPGQTATLTVTATGRSGERVTSTPAGISVAVGTTGSASFTTGTSITLTVSNGRDAIWSGACSSGGNKAKTCTFTLTANASVTANVQ